MLVVFVVVKKVAVDVTLIGCESYFIGRWDLHGVINAGRSLEAAGSGQ